MHRRFVLRCAPAAVWLMQTQTNIEYPCDVPLLFFLWLGAEKLGAASKSVNSNFWVTFPGVVVGWESEKWKCLSGPPSWRAWDASHARARLESKNILLWAHAAREKFNSAARARSRVGKRNKELFLSIAPLIPEPPRPRTVFLCWDKTAPPLLQSTHLIEIKNLTSNTISPRELFSNPN